MKLLRKEIVSERELIAIGRTLGTAAMLGAILLQRRISRRRYVKHLETELRKARGRMLYLASLIDKHGVEVDEFDLIALREME